MERRKISGNESYWNTIDHTVDDVTLCLLLQLPACIAHYLSNDVINYVAVACLQSAIRFSGFQFEFQSFLANGLLGLLQSGMKMTIF